MSDGHGSARTLGRLLKDIEEMLKQPSIGLELARGGVNTSIALIAVQGLSAYVEGNLRRAQEDLATAADELQARLSRR